jgi:hypothetical protein
MRNKSGLSTRTKIWAVSLSSLFAIAGGGQVLTPASGVALMNTNACHLPPGLSSGWGTDEDGLDCYVQAEASGGEGGEGEVIDIWDPQWCVQPPYSCLPPTPPGGGSGAPTPGGDGDGGAGSGGGGSPAPTPQPAPQPPPDDLDTKLARSQCERIRKRVSWINLELDDEYQKGVVGWVIRHGPIYRTEASILRDLKDEWRERECARLTGKKLKGF